MAAATHTPHNHLIHALPEHEREHLRTRLTLIRYNRGEVLLEPGQRISSVLFPVGCAISLLQIYHGGETIEVANVGCEGAVCLSSTLAGHDRSHLRLRVQIGGGGARISTGDFNQCLIELPVFRRLVMQSAAGLLGMAYLGVACNRLHSVEQRLVRALLMMRDRISADRLPLTHEVLSDILGVTRPTVSEAARALARCHQLPARPSHNS
jgi:CRP-like cAMP-binding protein